LVEYNIEIENKKLFQSLRRWEREMPDFIRGLLSTFGRAIDGDISTNLIAGKFGITSSGSVNGKSRSGDLADSVFSTMKGRDVVEIGAGSGIVYARIHEYGGTIRAKNAPYLRFSVPGGGFVTTKSVYIPPRPYVRPTMVEFFRDGGADTLARGYFNRKKREYGFE